MSTKRLGALRRVIGSLALGATAVAATTAVGAQAAAPAGSGRPVFSPVEIYPVRSPATSTALLDVNDDGRNDVLVTTGPSSRPNADHKLLVYRQAVDGTLLKPPMRLSTDGGDGSMMSISTGDLNGDGRADVAIALSAGIDLFYSVPGGLSLPTLIPTDSWAMQVIVADVNGDGAQDLVVDTLASVSLLVNDGSTFQARPISDVTQTVIALADVTADGRPDVVGFTQYTVHVFAQQPNGSFRGPYDFVADSDRWMAFAVATGDVTSDGRADVVLTIEANQPYSVVNVFRQRPRGHLAIPIAIPSHDTPGPVVVADVNGDGKQDVVVAHCDALAVGIYYQRGGGGLRSEQLLPIPWSNGCERLALSVGDFSGDGKADIALADPYNGLLLLRQT